LCAVIDDGDFESCWACRGRREHDRHHTTRYQQDVTTAA
jgi:hypothetical protein